jgi:rhamnogalacturonyl hydrolase YesR
VNTIDRVKHALLTIQRASWEQGVTAQAFLELGDTETVILLAHDAIVRQLEDGRLAGWGSWDAVTDPAANGEAVLFAARATGNPWYQQAADRMLDYLLHKAPRTESGVIHHILSKPQVWIDAMHMAPPFLAAAGHPAEAVKQITGMRDLLWDSEKQLYSHIWDDGQKTFARKAFWGVGNGWTAAGIVMVLGALPDSMDDEKKRLIGYLSEVLDGCLRYQRDDGLFHNVVDDPNSFVEVNLGQMLAYSIYTAVRNGWINTSYLPAADKARAAAHTKVDEYGFVQDVCGSPDFDHPGTAAEGQAFFLRMEAAYQKLNDATDAPCSA